MNFLLHRHLGARDLGSAVAGVGAMLPDLWRMADRRARASHHPRVDALPDGTAALLMAGIRHHLVADRWFHADAVFAGGELEAVRLLREANLEARHISLFGHVLWELCLDGELVRREGEARVLSALREGFERAGSACREVAARHRRERSGFAGSPDEWTAFEREMDRICEALARGPWVAGYAHGDGIAARIGGVRTRFGLSPLAKDDAKRLAGIAEVLLERAAPAVSRIFEWKFEDGADPEGRAVGAPTP